MVSEKTKEKKETTKKKRMISVNFVGKEMLNGEVFDTTKEDVAKEHDIYDPKRQFKALTIIPGEKEMLPKVEKELETMKEGEEKTVKLSPKDGFGERNSDLVRILPAKVFAEQKIAPVPGLVINVGNAMGKVQSVSGGRVRVDFNHLLAGRDLEYTVKVEKEYKTKKEFAEQLYDKYYSIIPETKKEIKEENLYITVPEQFSQNLKEVNKSVTDLGKAFGIKVSFKEEKTKKETKEEEKK
jgi:FKBP-type peptidyl-prolyl cis-trans isomerase 2